MNTVKIEDMPVVEELSSEEMAAVHGGTMLEPLLFIDHILITEPDNSGGMLLAGGLSGARNGVK